MTTERAAMGAMIAAPLGPLTRLGSALGASSDTGRTGRYGRGAAVLSIGIGASGALTYAYFALASHELSTDDYGSLVLLWSVLFVAVFTLYRPIEQLVSRTVSERAVTEAPAGPALRAAARIQGLIVVAFVVAALLLRGPIEDGLLSGETTLYWVFLVAGPAYAVSFLTRGYLAGTGRFGLYGATLLLESVSRFLIAVLAVVGVVEGVDAIAIAIALAPLLTLAVIPAIVLRRAGAGPAADGPTPDSDIDVMRGGHFVAAAFVIMLSEQALLNAGVVILGATATAAAAGLLFNVLLLARAPQVLFGAVTTSLLPSLTRHRTEGGEAGFAAFRRETATTVRSVLAGAAAIALVVAIAGPRLMELTFGSDHDYGRAGLLIVVAGMACHLCALTLTQASLARDRAASAAARWAGCAAAFVAWSFLPLLEDVRRIEVGYAGAAALLVLLLLADFRAGEET